MVYVLVTKFPVIVQLLLFSSSIPDKVFLMKLFVIVVKFEFFNTNPTKYAGSLPDIRCALKS